MYVTNKCLSLHRLCLQNGSLIPFLFHFHYYLFTSCLNGFIAIASCWLPTHFWALISSSHFGSYFWCCHSPDVNLGNVALAMLLACLEILDDSLMCIRACFSVYQLTFPSRNFSKCIFCSGTYSVAQLMNQLNIPGISTLCLECLDSSFKTFQILLPHEVSTDSFQLDGLSPMFEPLEFFFFFLASASHVALVIFCLMQELYIGLSYLSTL